MQMTRLEKAARLEDLQWIAETGGSVEEAAKRLGLSIKALERWCRDNKGAAADAYSKLRRLAV